MLHPSDTERLEQLEQDYRALKAKYDRLLDYLGLDENCKERQTIPAPPPGSDPPKAYCACSSPACDICHP